MLQQPTIDALKDAFPGIALSEFRGQWRMVVPREQQYQALKELKDRHDFDFLVDITCVDYLHYREATDRFGLVYLLARSRSNERIAVRVFMNDPNPTVASVVRLWEGANWMEREVYDMFGIAFEGHPDLRRILMPDEFTGYPLRKDYPLQGRGERHNFPSLTRAES